MINFVLFSTSTCAFCKPMKASLEKLVEKHPKDVTLTVWTVDKEPEGMKMAKMWGISKVPITVVILDGEEIAKLEGAVPISRLEELVEGSIQRDVLPEPSGGSDDSGCPVLCDSSQ